VFLAGPGVLFWGISRLQKADLKKEETEGREKTGW